MPMEPPKPAIETLSDRELLELIGRQQAFIMQEFERFRPLLERYERAASAGNLFQQRRALKNG